MITRLNTHYTLAKYSYNNSCYSHPLEHTEVYCPSYDELNHLSGLRWFYILENYSPIKITHSNEQLIFGNCCQT